MKLRQSAFRGVALCFGFALVSGCSAGSPEDETSGNSAIIFGPPPWQEEAQMTAQWDPIFGVYPYTFGVSINGSGFCRGTFTCGDQVEIFAKNVSIDSFGGGVNPLGGSVTLTSSPGLPEVFSGGVVSNEAAGSVWTAAIPVPCGDHFVFYAYDETTGVYANNGVGVTMAAPACPVSPLPQ